MNIANPPKPTMYGCYLKKRKVRGTDFYLSRAQQWPRGSGWRDIYKNWWETATKRLRQKCASFLHMHRRGGFGHPIVFFWQYDKAISHCNRRLHPYPSKCGICIHRGRKASGDHPRRHAAVGMGYEGSNRTCDYRLIKRKEKMPCVWKSAADIGWRCNAWSVILSFPSTGNRPW